MFKAGDKVRFLNKDDPYEIIYVDEFDYVVTRGDYEEVVGKNRAEQNLSLIKPKSKFYIDI